MANADSLQSRGDMAYRFARLIRSPDGHYTAG